MSIPTNLSVAPGGTVNIPVNLLVTGNSFDAAHGNGISGVSFIISYNTSLPVTVGTFSLGSMISTPSYGFNGYLTNNAPGLILASSISNPPGTSSLAPGTSGQVAMIPFTLDVNATPGVYQLTLLGSSGSTFTTVTDNSFSDYKFNSTPPLTLVSGTLTVTPEPGTLALLGLSAIGLAVRRKWIANRPSLS